MTEAASPTEPLAEDAATDAAAELRPLSLHVEIRRVAVLVNGLSGSVGPRAAAEVERILADYPLEGQVIALEDGDFDGQISDALDARPDVLFVLAGDGTARSVASRAGPQGPLIAPLPGGTMNMLPKALYGTADWKAALRKALEEGAPQHVAGGEVQGQAFYCAAILGTPALWAPAREAIRTGKLSKAWSHARRALKRAFTGRLRYQLDGGRLGKTEALVLISPMISRALDEPIGLEAAAMDPHDTGQAFRLAATALFSDWRSDASVTTRPARRIEVRSRSRIPAVIDGEPVQLPPEAVVRFLPKAFRALAPLPPAAEDSV
ncbi:diacylglycerol/lipid kinase family protein [Brevundimonas sp. VNH65]|uniref:diacylglycerol/lipid kinase family protein n=1 Tax=Brevundimonas sp. VNH65 TaxID=3400917 RepID=UPI003C02BC07